ncbi:MAG TPA: cytochrome c-type biogenesis protein [Nitrospiria bacterium]|jgi:cytochrome c-type biogenesis protein CcmH
MIWILPFIIFSSFTFPIVSMGNVIDERKIDLQVRDLAKTLRCAVCQNESIWESNAELAKQMRAIIRERLEKGESTEDIRAYFLSRYGDYILLKPQKKGLNWLLWGGPFLLLLVGGVILYRTLGKWVRETQKEKPEGVPSIDESSRKRIDQELRKFRE